MDHVVRALGWGDFLCVPVTHLNQVLQCVVWERVEVTSHSDFSWIACPKNCILSLLQLFRVWHKLRMADTTDEVMDRLKEAETDIWRLPTGALKWGWDVSRRISQEVSRSAYWVRPALCELGSVRNAVSSFLIVDRTWVRGEENIQHATKKSNVI